MILSKGFDRGPLTKSVSWPDCILFSSSNRSMLHSIVSCQWIHEAHGTSYDICFLVLPLLLNHFSSYFHQFSSHHLFQCLLLFDDYNFGMGNSLVGMVFSCNFDGLELDLSRKVCDYLFWRMVFLNGIFLSFRMMLPLVSCNNELFPSFVFFILVVFLVFLE